LTNGKPNLEPTRLKTPESGSLHKPEQGKAHWNVTRVTELIFMNGERLKGGSGLGSMAEGNPPGNASEARGSLGTQAKPLYWTEQSLGNVDATPTSAMSATVVGNAQRRIGGVQLRRNMYLWQSNALMGPLSGKFTGCLCLPSGLGADDLFSRSECFINA